MEFIETKLKGVYMINCFSSSDNRGLFTKVFNADEMKAKGLFADFKELFYTTSNANTIRGMHFNVPPQTQIKLIHCIVGSVQVVLLDLRKKSSTYLKFQEFRLQGNTKQALYLPVGIALGYKSLEDNSRVMYFSSVGFSKECDSGIKYDSFGYDWKTDNPILSERDKKLVNLKDFNNPF